MQKLTCKQREELFHQGPVWGVYSGLTDAYGTYGEPTIMTTWYRDNERLEDIRHPHYGEYSPGKDGDRKPCEHYYWIEEEE